MQTVLITGGTGLVGKALSSQLTARGYKVIVLTRSKPQATSRKGNEQIDYAEWNVNKQTIDLKAIQKADYIIHIAGAGVMDKKWTAAYKKEIQESRTKSSKLITTTLKNIPNKVKAV